jgi:hypothetical protein
VVPSLSPGPESCATCLMNAHTRQVKPAGSHCPVTRLIVHPEGRACFLLAPPELMKSRVLRFGLLEDGDVRVGVFPEGEEILVGRTGLGGVAGEGDSAGKTQAGERT